MAEWFEPKVHQPRAENVAVSKKNYEYGEMAERLNAAVSKTVILGNWYREFESLSLRSKKNPLELLVLRDFSFFNDRSFFILI